MGVVRDDEHYSPLDHRSTISAGRLLDELLEKVNTNGSSSLIQTPEKAKSPPITNEGSLPPNVAPSPPPMEAPTTSKSKRSPSSLLQRILEGLQSQHQQQQQQPQQPSHTSSRPRSRHSRHRSSRSSETMTAMLLIAADRLSRETSRANEAERQSSEILAHFKIAHQAKKELEINLQRVKDELGLYKTQLNIAQAEIHRAQGIVDKVDQQRADAEDEARRGREKVRNLTEERVVASAMEEGRRMGYEEGMRQSRLMMQARDNDEPSRYYRRTSFRSTRDDNDDEVSYFSYRQEERHSTESSRSPTNPSTSVRSSSRRRRTSNATQSVPPVSPSSISHSIPTASGHNQVTSSTLKLKPDNNSNHPENIAIQPHSTKDSEPIRPVSIRNQSPTISHRSFKLPPDGYIPTLDANSVISLPPPHELSIPVPPTGTSQPSAAATTSDSKQEEKKAYTSQPSEYTDRESVKCTPKSVSTNHVTLSRQRRTYDQPTRTGPKSEASRTSTFISESSLLGPPAGIGRKENAEGADYFNEGTRGILATTQPERMAAKWRCVNPDMTPSPSPSLARSTFLDGYNEATSSRRGNFAIEHPKTTDPAQRPQSRSSRRPREIVLPTIKTLLNPSIVQKFDCAAQEATDQWQYKNDRSSSPGYRDERPQLFHGSGSVPGIEIVTPSSPNSSKFSERTVIDPVLLTPESANRPLPVPPNAAPNSSLGLYINPPTSMSISGDEEPRITMTLLDNKFPPGFIPLSPIPGMKNLDSYPSGFTPSIPVTA